MNFLSRFTLLSFFRLVTFSQMYLSLKVSSRYTLPKRFGYQYSRKSYEYHGRYSFRHLLRSKPNICLNIHESDSDYDFDSPIYKRSIECLDFTLLLEALREETISQLGYEHYMNHVALNFEDC